MADPYRDSEQVHTTEANRVSDNLNVFNFDDSTIKKGDELLHHRLIENNIASTSSYVMPKQESEQQTAVTMTNAAAAGVLPGPGSSTGLSLRTVSIGEFNLGHGKANHSGLVDVQTDVHSNVVQVQANGSENILVNNNPHHTHTHHHPVSSVSVLTADKSVTGTSIDTEFRVKSEVCNFEGSSMDDQIISVNHQQMPGEGKLSYSSSNDLTLTVTDNSTTDFNNESVVRIMHENVGSITTAPDAQNQTQTMIQLDQSIDSDLSQMAGVKSQLKFHTIPNSPTVQITAPRGISMTPEVLQSVIQQVKAQQLCQQSSQQPQPAQLAQSVSEDDNRPQNNGVSFTLVSPSQQNSVAAPLGSSQNPIRIIQQGNRYTPMQQLTTEQLQQIMQVVQQQHTSTSNNVSKSQDNSGAVIFNPHTNTKIMYRVIYPSELHKSQTASGQATYQVLKPVTLSQEQQTTTTPHQKRPYRKRKDVTAQLSGVVPNVDEDKERGSGDAPELSKEEKEERKKHRPRTRSGRVSKPPKHMVQDYKHIHVLDWDEDYDDSDGGYSDLKHSDEEAKSRRNEEGEQEASPDLFQALGAGKPKNYKCQVCEKSYIGQAGLERHYRLAPEHRRSENGDIGSQLHDSMMVDGEDSSKDTSITQDGNSRNSDPGPDTSKSNGLVDNFSEDSNTQDSVYSIGTSSPIVRRGRGRGCYRGRWAHLKHNAHARRKNKLREFTKMCSDEDLMEVLFPRLVGCMSTWEFLLMKAEKGGSRPKVDVIYKEFEDLLRPLKKVCADYMKLVAEKDVPNLNSFEKLIKVRDQNLASCLGLNVGTYKVDEMLPDDSNSFSSLHNKLSAASISLSTNSTTLDRNETSHLEKVIRGEKRKYDITSPSKLDYIPMKKPSCLMTSLSSNTSEQPSTPFNGLQNSSNESISPETTCTAQLVSPSAHSLHSSACHSPTFVKMERAPPSLSSLSHPSVPYLISDSNGKDNTATSQTLNPQLVPLVLNTGSGNNSVAVSSSQVLPIVFSPRTSQSTVCSTLSGTQAGQINSLPLLLTGAGNQLQGSTIFLASGNQTAGQNVLVTQPSSSQAQKSATLQHNHQQQQRQQLQQKQKYVSSQILTTSPISKSQVSLLGTVSKSNSCGATKVTVSSSSSSSSSSSMQRFDLNAKPAEVKVSRKLFHEATASSSFLPVTTSSSLSSLPSSSSYVTSGSHPNNTILVNSPHKVNVNFGDNSDCVSTLLSSPSLSASSQAENSNNYLQSVSTTSLGNVKRDLENGVLNFNTLQFGSRTIEAPAIVSVAQLSTASVSDMNRVVTTGNDEDLDSSFDISAGVLSSIGFSGDELSSLNTSSDNPPSIPVSLPTLGVNHVSSVINEMIAPSSNDISNGVSLIEPTKAVAGNDASMHTVNTTISPFINGSTSEFPSISPPPPKVKNNLILPSSQSSSSFISSSSDFIHLISNRPSSPLMSSPCKDGGLNNSTSAVSFNLTSMDNSLQPQILKAESTPSTMMDLGTLSFSDQSVEQQLNGVTSNLHSGDVDGILPEQITHSVETVNPMLELPQQQLVGDDVAMSTPAGEEEGQLLLTEGSNIYQTEDGSWFIQSADGNTYQLQGAQGLPMEAVQALLSGNLDLNGDVQTDETVQAAGVIH